MQDSEVNGLVGQSLGQYRLRSMLGVGGMATVYRALDPALEREVAVKVLPASLATDAEYVRRFRDEAKQVAALHHPHIMPIYAVGEERGHSYFVMPVLQGSLRDLLRQQDHLPPAAAVRLTQQIASALEAAHALGLIHRDVKPGNILLDPDGNALLTDFGIARPVTTRHGAEGPTLAGTGLPVGTPQYMAPEQLRGEDLDQRVDVYALGTVLYESLTGVAPHVADSPFEVAALALSAPILPPSQRNPQVWPELEQVVLKALARQATNRYPDMQSFSAALELALRRHVTYSTVATLTASQTRETGARVLASLRELRWTRRTVAMALAVVLLIATAGGTALVMARGGTTSRGPLSVATSSATASETQASETVVALIPTATTSAQPSVSPAPRASPTPSPTLIVNPTPWVLQPTQPGNLTGNCIGTQTIRNTTSQTVGWQWLQPQGGFHFQVNGGPDMGWPKNLQPGIPPHGTDTVTATGKCQPLPKPYGILLTDSLGDQYTFVLQLQ